jgi:carbamoyltransferase
LVDRVENAAEALDHGKIIGWFDGRMEFGPRALGSRSILADPRSAVLKDKLNSMVKEREVFRPFGAAFLAREMNDWLVLPNPEIDVTDVRSLMLLTYEVRPELRRLIPAVVHADGTCRVQALTEDDGTFYLLVRRFFERTGIPLVLNTSMNVNEPIVCTPKDAIRMAQTAGLDLLYLESYECLPSTARLGSLSRQRPR